MGLFDKLKAAGAPQFNPQRAVMTIIIAAIKADGDVSDDEISRLRSICARSPIFASNTKEEDDRLIDFAATVTDQLKDAAVSSAAEALTTEIRETAFAFACDMMLADGMVTDAEERYLGALARTLQLDDAVVQTLVHATVIRNRSL